MIVYNDNTLPVAPSSGRMDATAELERLRIERDEVLAWARKAYKTFQAIAVGIEMDKWQSAVAPMFYAPNAVKAIDSEKG